MINKNLLNIKWSADCGCGGEVTKKEEVVVKSSDSCGCSGEVVDKKEDSACCSGDGDQECGCEDDNDIAEDTILVMIDQDTNEEFQFRMVDDFQFEDQVYCVLMTLDENPEALIVRVVNENDEQQFMSLENDEYDRVVEEYERILAQMDLEDEMQNDDD